MLCIHPDQLWTHTVSCPVGNGDLSLEEWSGWSMKLTSHFHLVLKLICGALSPLTMHHHGMCLGKGTTSL